VVSKELTEGHARALLMLQDRPDERDTLFKEIVLKKTSVRVAGQLARRIAQDKIRKHNKTPEMMQIEKDLTESLGTRVIIENRPKGGRVLIEFFSPEDLTHIVELIAAEREAQAFRVLDSVEAQLPDMEKVEIEPGDVLIPNTTLLTETSLLPNGATTNEFAQNFTILEPLEEIASVSTSVTQLAQPNQPAQPVQQVPQEESYELLNFTV
jgi:hypothetical protein